MAVQVVEHPLVRHKLGLLRRKDLSTKNFRELTAELGRLLTYEATKDLVTEAVTVNGWAGPVEVEQIKGKKITVVPILRAGLCMMPGVLDMVPSAKVSVVVLFRDETTLEPVAYYEKLASDMTNRMAIILDPMLATGGSLVATVEMLKKSGCRDIRSLCLVAAPEGIARLMQRHPAVDLYRAGIDETLNAQGYILPGLGDAGDKIFGTK